MIQSCQGDGLTAFQSLHLFPPRVRGLRAQRSLTPSVLWEPPDHSAVCSNACSIKVNPAECHFWAFLATVWITGTCLPEAEGNLPFCLSEPITGKRMLFSDSSCGHSWEEMSRREVGSSGPRQSKAGAVAVLRLSLTVTVSSPIPLSSLCISMNSITISVTWASANDRS